MDEELSGSVDFKDVIRSLKSLQSSAKDSDVGPLWEQEETLLLDFISLVGPVGLEIKTTIQTLPKERISSLLETSIELVEKLQVEAEKLKAWTDKYPNQLVRSRNNTLGCVKNMNRDLLTAFGLLKKQPDLDRPGIPDVKRMMEDALCKGVPNTRAEAARGRLSVKLKRFREKAAEQRPTPEHLVGRWKSLLSQYQEWTEKILKLRPNVAYQNPSPHKPILELPEGVIMPAEVLTNPDFRTSNICKLLPQLTDKARREFLHVQNLREDVDKKRSVLGYELSRCRALKEEAMKLAQGGDRPEVSQSVWEALLICLALGVEDIITAANGLMSSGSQSENQQVEALKSSAEKGKRELVSVIPHSPL